MAYSSSVEDDSAFSSLLIASQAGPWGLCLGGLRTGREEYSSRPVQLDWAGGAKKTKEAPYLRPGWARPTDARTCGWHARSSGSGGEQMSWVDLGEAKGKVERA